MFIIRNKGKKIFSKSNTKNFIKIKKSRKNYDSFLFLFHAV